PEPVYDQSLVAHDGHLANAVVWIKGGLERWVFAVPTETVTIDQRGCLYQPRVTVAMAGQPVEFLNSDTEAHNIHGRPKVVDAWNFMMSRQGANRSLTFDKAEVAIPIGCDIHPWMAGYLAVPPTPYAAVPSESGTATLNKVPPGTY